MTGAELDVAILGLAGVSKRYAFNGQGYYVRARLFALLESGLQGEPPGIVLRLPEPQRTLALEREGARTFTLPRSSDRHDWVFVPFGPPSAEADAQIAEWGRQACDHVAAMELPRER